MDVFEDDLTYMALRNPVADNIKVYIDSSFNVGGQGRSIAGNGTCAGTGWVIESPTGGIVGYGLNSLLDEPSISSELWELRGIIAFFNTLKQYRPDLLNQDNEFEVHCDNSVLVDYLNRDGEGSSIKRLKTKHVQPLEEFRAVTNISFRWVKGHAGNVCNSIADRLARRAAVIVQLEAEELNYYERQSFIYSLLSQRGISDARKIITLPVPEEVQKRRAAYNARHRKTQEERDAHLEIFCKSAFIEIIAKPSGNGSLTRVTATNENGIELVVNVDTPHYSKTARSIAAVASVLERYWDSKTVDPFAAITLYGNCGQAGAAVNTIRKGKEPDSIQSAIDADVAREIVRLRSIMGGKSVRYLDNAVVRQILATG